MIAVHRHLVVTALLLQWGAAAWASPDPLLRQDLSTARVSQVPFVPDEVTRVLGAVDHPVLIEFSATEPIEDVAGGGISGWEVQKRAHRLFVRATPQATTGTLLVTSRTRSYVFDLVPVRATRKGASARYMSKIVFAYDAPPVPAPQGSAGAVSAVPAKLEQLPLGYPLHQPYRNTNYTMQVVTETVDIRPREAFDDGRFTWLLFPRNQELPVVYKSVPGTEEEVVVNSHMEGDYLVLHAVAPLWNLRLGGSVVGVFNESYDAMGVGSGTKTVFPNVVRVDKP
jgi:type IV secretion system protein VirB9